MNGYNNEPQIEHVAFPNNCPCRVRSRSCAVDEIGIPHYATTIEITLTEGIGGNVYIGNESFEVNEDRDAFFVAPEIVHYSNYFRGNGKIHVFKISLELLSKFVDINAILQSANCSMLDIPCHLTDSYETLHRFIFEKISYGTNNFATVRGIVGLFEHLCLIAKSEAHEKKKPTNDKILDIIKWTQDRVCEKISVEDAAAYLHYSKYHFCRLFKESVGTTYLNYVNTLKISHAIKLMQEGHSATYCCFECGFNSLAYFLKLFKDVTGFTTGEYKDLINSNK